MMKHGVVFFTVMALAVYQFILLAISGAWSQLLLPIILIGLMLWFYLKPPRTYASHGKKQPKVKPSAATMAKLGQTKNGTKPASTAKKRKDYPFHVIEGNKKDKNDPDVPKYH
ncbi:hypothetical protein [Paenibacillus sp. Marseille-Q4541]|uniref:hypothetical protein n=1 Tax=Paenibacillus sp. Marseille-Q4541 TaxID=2831522 RepID=UPI001BAC5C41|nr:hypothetical protein [Paenibacillus sp. Marseille-Q4541]